MEAASYSKTLLSHHITTRPHNPEDNYNQWLITYVSFAHNMSQNYNTYQLTYEVVSAKLKNIYPYLDIFIHLSKQPTLSDRLNKAKLCWVQQAQITLIPT
jgi:hypothetical protein